MRIFYFFIMLFIVAPFFLSPLEAGRKKHKEPLPQVSNHLLILPKQWHVITDPSQLPPKIKEIHIGIGKGSFNPSINLACEPTTLPLEEYLELAKKHHNALRDTQCQELGSVETQSGLAHLFQIDQKSHWGDIRCLQAILLHQETAYVITATSLQEEFATHLSFFHQTIKSFQTPLN